MQAVIALLLAVIALILFQRFVTIEQKRILRKRFQILAALAGIIFIAAAAWNALQGWRAEQLLESVSVSYVSPAHDSLTIYQRMFSEKDNHLRESVTFTMCNTGRKPVASIKFWPRTLEDGRSTEHNVAIPESLVYYDDQFAMTSDFIIPANKCLTTTWRGSFYVRDSVTAEVLEVVPNSK